MILLRLNENQCRLELNHCSVFMTIESEFPMTILNAIASLAVSDLPAAYLVRPPAGQAGGIAADAGSSGVEI